jgi:ketosteroid isomerase-like protein
MSQVNPRSSAQSTTQPTFELQQLLLQQEQQIIDAVRRNDMNLWQELVAEDWSLINWLGQPATRQQILTAFNSRDLRVDSYECEDLQARIFGDAAIVTGLVNVKGAYQGMDIDGPYRFTDFWCQRNGHWQIVATQQTPVQQSSGTYQ